MYVSVFPSKHTIFIWQQSILFKNKFQVYDCFIWTVIGSRRIFGTLTHKKVVVLVDTSGSMESRMNDLKKELAALIWDQIYKQEIRYEDKKTGCVQVLVHAGFALLELNIIMICITF